MSEGMELPEGWALPSFLEVFDIQGGTQPPKSEFLYDPTPGYVQLLQIRDFGERPVPTFIPDSRKLKKCSFDDVLIARYGASLGRILTGMEGAYNVAMAKVDIPEFINKRFVVYVLRSGWFQEPLMLVSRSAQNGFNKEDLSQFHQPLPPLPEQKVIADTLDVLLAQVDTLRGRLDAIPAILKRFRQSVLSAAVSGKLTEEWRGASSPGVWRNVRLRDVCVSINDGDHQAPPQAASGVRFITISAINDGYLRLEKATRNVTKAYWDGLKDERKAKVGDILYSVTGSIGIPAIVDTSEPFAFQRHIALIRTDESRMSRRFLLKILDSEEIRKQAFDIATGTAQLTIPLSGLRNLTVDLPPLPEQHEIVRRVEELFAFADQIGERVREAQGRAKHLTQSILAKAFRGELTQAWREAHPELVSGENAASALLERIQAARAGVVGKRGRKEATAPEEVAPGLMAAEPVAVKGRGRPKGSRAKA